MEALKKHIEENKELVDIVRFMIKDNMFATEFILTAILDYLEENQKEIKEL